MRWHPMMLRLAILIHSRSAQAYETLRATGILQLPSESTLRDYTNVFHPKPGFQKSAIDEIIRQTKDFKDEQRYVALLHDEMSIKADLVYDKRSGELVGLVSKDTCFGLLCCRYNIQLEGQSLEQKVQQLK